MPRNPGQMAPDPTQYTRAGGEGDITGFATLTAGCISEPCSGERMS